MLTVGEKALACILLVICAVFSPTMEAAQITSLLLIALIGALPGARSDSTRRVRVRRFNKKRES